MTGLLLCDDLIFSSRITGTAQSLGFGFRVARTPSEVEKLAGEDKPSCAILDLANAGPAIGDLVAHLRTNGRCFIVGYGSHVDTATLRAAREAGCDLVLPRSKFVEELPVALPGWLRAGS